MSLHQVQNAIRILHSIDAHELGNPDWWPEFRADPTRYLIHCSDKTAKAIWAVMVQRGVDRAAA